MKTINVLFIFLIITMIGCKNYEEQVEQLQATNQELSNSLERCNSLLAEYRNTVNEIEASIYRTLPEERQAGQTEDLQQLKSRINSAISEIDSLLQASEQQQQTLRNRTYRIGSRVSNLEEEISELNRQLETRDSMINIRDESISELNNNIEDLNSEIEDFKTRTTEMEETAEGLTNRLNYAYFTSGSEDELEEKNIIQKTGGFLGFLGQVKKLNPQLELNQLERIDIRNKNSFEVNTEADDLQLISPHPEGSYTIEPNGEESVTVTINNPDEFWKVSRYLVMVTD